METTYNFRHACLSVCRSAHIYAAPIGRISIKLYIQRTYTEICRDNPSLVTVRQKSQPLYTETELCFIVAIMVLCLGDMVAGC